MSVVLVSCSILPPNVFGVLVLNNKPLEGLFGSGFSRVIEMIMISHLHKGFMSHHDSGIKGLEGLLPLLRILFTGKKKQSQS